MAFVRAFEIILAIGIGWLVISQIIIPSINGLPLFPALWRKQDKLATEKALLNERIAEKSAEAELQELRNKLNASSVDDQEGNKE